MLEIIKWIVIAIIAFEGIKIALSIIFAVIFGKRMKKDIDRFDEEFRRRL